MTNNWTLAGADGQVIYGNTHLPQTSQRGVLIICHGFKGYKDYGFLPYLARSAAQHGLIVHRFNFSHSGMTNKLDTFEHPELFEKDTWGKQIFDLQQVIQAARSGKLKGKGEPGAMTLFGHSRGGVTVLLTAARDQPDCVIGAATPHTGGNLDDNQKKLLLAAGFLPSPSARTGQNLRIGKECLMEMQGDPKAFDPLVAIKSLTCPVLLLHGDQDATVSIDSAAMLKRAAGDLCQLQIIADASHTFNAPNPMASDNIPVQTQQIVDHVCDFARGD